MGLGNITFSLKIFEHEACLPKPELWYRLWWTDSPQICTHNVDFLVRKFQSDVLNGLKAASESHIGGWRNLPSISQKIWFALDRICISSGVAVFICICISKRDFKWAVLIINKFNISLTENTAFHIVLRFLRYYLRSSSKCLYHVFGFRSR